MIIPRSSATSLASSFGPFGYVQNLAPGAIHNLVYAMPSSLMRPLTIVPLKIRNVARVAMLASSRTHAGFMWHNSCYQLTPANWRRILTLARPDYLLVESCGHDSLNAWPLFCHRREYADMMGAIADTARRAGVPSIFWHTLPADMVDIYIDAMRHFDVAACADAVALEKIAAAGIDCRPLPWGFAPEQFNQLHNSGKWQWAPMLLFDGIARMMRNAGIADILRMLAGDDLSIVDTSYLVPPYNIARCGDNVPGDAIKGCVSHDAIQELYKTATACLSLPESDGRMSPGPICQALEAAACRCPVLHCGRLDAPLLEDFCEIFTDAASLQARYRHLRANRLERDASAHKAWRAVHTRHTFSHRMRTIHEWLGLDTTHFKDLSASMVVPSMRPQNFASVLAMYDAQTYAPRELVYVFNGPPGLAPQMPDRPDIVFRAISPEYSTGTVMNAGTRAANGDIIFKCDDDDLYGPNYMLDRMILFTEFAIDVLSNATNFFTFGDSGQAVDIASENADGDNTVFCMGNAAYAMLKYTGGTVAMRKKHALRASFMGNAYAHEDVAQLLKGIFLTPTAVYAKVDGFNFCVVRNSVGSHTWAASHSEIMKLARSEPVPLESVFI